MKRKFGFLLVFLLNIFTVKQTFAMCPLCAVAVGAGLGLSRWLGVDDTISGIWVGGLLVSLIMWTENWLEKKNIKFKLRWLVTAAVYYSFTIIPLYYSEIIGHPFNKLWGIDKLMLGILFGGAVFFLACLWYLHLKAKNNNHAYFPFQKVAMPVGSSAILTAIFYFLTSSR